MVGEFKENMIAEYTYWKLMLHPNQSYLGWSVIWCKRADAIDLMHATPAEKDELFEIGEQLQTGLDTLFQPDLYNYAALGNVTPHLHVHFIPRYRTPREFSGQTFNDERWGQNHAPYDKSFSIPRPVFDEIKGAITRELKKSPSF